MTMVFGSTDVTSLTMPEAVEVVERMYAEGTDRDLVSHTPVRMQVPQGSLRIVTGAMLGAGLMGARIGSASGLAGDASIQTIFDARTGDLLAVMPAPTGVLRTGAVAGAATNWMSRTDSSVAALIGTGRNALSLLEGMVVVRPLDEIRVWSRDARKRSEFAAKASARLDRTVHAAPTVADAVAGADVVTCMTNSDTPVVKAADLLPDVHVNSLGSVNELPADLYVGAAAIAVGSKYQELHYRHYHAFDHHAPPHGLLELADCGVLDWTTHVHELSDTRPGCWARPAGRTVFKDSRGGTGDLALAYEIYRRAVQHGGVEIDFTAPSRAR